MPEAPAHPLFSHALRVYWEDTDGGGVVYHAGYLRFLERARTEWLRSRGVEQAHWQRQHDTVFAIRELSIGFRQAARLDDALLATVDAVWRRAASPRFAPRIPRESDGAVLAEAEVRAACLRASDFRPRPLPEGLLDDLPPEPGRVG
jgi:acyl-CoA thioester hydrolase